MKANIKQNKKNSDVLLSIGMIVKNEEKVLRRCLESLKLLMEQISCELIIADTGSTDSTVEIAREYTDNVFYFEWINDFAAARNSTLEKAKGQWYMFIDADEYLDEDIHEMVRFFNIPELVNKYKTIEIMIRSYTDPEKKEYVDACLPRFQRIDDKENPVYFVGSIHESIYIRNPLGYFSTIIHHTGYAYSSKQQKNNKSERNISLMCKEYKTNPENLRIVCHLIDGISSYNSQDSKGIKEYIDEALILVRKKRRDLYANIAYIQLIKYYQNEDPDFALDLCNEYHDSLDDSCKFVASVEVALLKANILCSKYKFESAYEAFWEYINLYKSYKNNELDLTDISAHPVMGLTEKEYYKALCSSALCLMKLRKFDEAFELLETVDISSLDGENYREVLATIRQLSVTQKKYDNMVLYYGKAMQTDDNNKRSLALYMLESVYYSLVDNRERRKFAINMINSGVSGRYIDLMKLVIEQADNDKFKADLLDFVNQVDNWNDGYSEAIYLSVKYGVDISNVVEKMDSSQFRTKLEEIANANDDFAGYVYDYGIPESYTSSIKKFYWITSLYEKASYRSFELDDSRRYELFNRFVSLLGDYVMNIYNPELLNDEDIQVLPNLHKFGFYMYQAQSALSAGDNIGYIRGMKKALLNCESMKEIVEFLLNYFKNNSM